MKGKMRFKSLALNPYLHLALLALVVVLTFSRTLGTYFLADDFGEINYVSRIAAGDMGMFIANFTGNYMQIPSMSVWRPWLLISLLTDCIIWGANPVGYYLTNLLSYVGVVLNLYLLVRNLSRDWCRTRSALAAFFAALIFALNPLHCESISWVVGRVDIVCAFFYLSCLNLFTLTLYCRENNRKKLTILSVVSFWLAMWTKEMAIGAPVMAFAIAMLWGRPPLALKKSFQLCRPLILSTLIYFTLRYMALGTVLGGYTQGIGDAQAAGALSHWLDVDTARRLFFPFAYSIYGSNPRLQIFLVLVYATLTSLFLLRLFSLSLPLRWLILLPVWLATALAPIYKLWGLGYELEGARFVFFATMPLACVFPIMLLAPHTNKAAAKSPGEKLFRPAYAGLSLALLMSLAALYGNIAARLNLEWVHAGKEVRVFAEQSRALATKLKQDAILLGIPKRLGGAHMILNGTTFQMVLQPPFAQQKVPDRFLTFDPIIFGNHDHINASRFKDCLTVPGMQIYVWDSEKRIFNSVAPPQVTGQTAAPTTIPLPPQTPPYYPHTNGHCLYDRSKSNSSGVTLTRISGDDGLYFDGLDLNPAQIDYAAVKINCPAQSGHLHDRAPLYCSWSEDAAALHSVKKDFQPLQNTDQTVYLKLSSNYRWYTQDRIRSVFLGLPPMDGLSVSELKLLPARAVEPQLTLSGASAVGPSHIGVSTIKVDSQAEATVTIPEELRHQAKEVSLEISKANAFFENFEEAEQGGIISQTLEKPVTGLSGESYKFALPLLSKGNNYEVRARLLDSKSQTLGAVSDTLVLRPQ